MARPKYRDIKLGPGNISDQDFECYIYVEPSAPKDGTPGTLVWGATTTYNLNEAVTYNGQSYNSLVNSNLGNQPDTSPSEWKEVDGKDGDIWVQVPAGGFPAGGGDCEIWLKVDKIWRPLSFSNPVTEALTDGQLTDAVAAQYPASLFPYAVFEYTVRRGSGQNRKRSGLMIILSDGATVNHTHEFSELGSDVNCPFDVSVSAGVVNVTYTSTLEAIPIELRYILRGWK